MNISINSTFSLGMECFFVFFNLVTTAYNLRDFLDFDISL